MLAKWRELVTTHWSPLGVDGMSNSLASRLESVVWPGQTPVTPVTAHFNSFCMEKAADLELQDVR